ncbi:hypothetical protein KSP39_PZI011156 [Platanthera zijinensis]|uniref:Uncharacterized protein n=1 Tax=Platanthera zijinensis TaxID=2320716 RepID=A0AAP0BIK1_9ASPA
MAEQQQNPASPVGKTPKSPLPSHRPPEFSVNSTAEAAWKSIKYPNPPEPVNPDIVTLRDQWRFAIRQYSRWYSHAWGTAIFAGLSFFALGWYIKGSNPLSHAHEDHAPAAGAPDTSDER